MSNHKSCGLNEIPAESWKTGLLSGVLLMMCNKVLKGDIPTAWKQAAIIPLPKKGNLSLLENYSGIQSDVSSCQDLLSNDPLTYQTP